ncbi:MAG TPA: hypothetical protein VFH45_02915, partial [Acidimicrobiales bacterium]|nr:hypothetical protein [Acidimicrobiales bacterium]
MEAVRNGAGKLATAVAVGTAMLLGPLGAIGSADTTGTPVASSQDGTVSRPVHGPGAERVDPPGRSGIHHPLSLEVLGYDVNGTPLVTSSTPSGYSPATIKGYLGLSGTGSGQTIAIVDAYNDPTIASDLSAFDSKFKLSSPSSFKKVSQTGSTSSYPTTDAGWSLEISLDVEWAHAVAP